MIYGLCTIVYFEINCLLFLFTVLTLKHIIVEICKVIWAEIYQIYLKWKRVNLIRI